MLRKLIVAVAGLVALGCEVALAKSVTCTMASLERTVELQYQNPGDAVPCEVRYAKPTEGMGEEVLWRAEHEAGYCEARFDEFVDKLRGFGWSCSEVASDVAEAGTEDVANEPAAPEAAVPEAAAPEAAPEVVAEEPATADAEAEEETEPTEADASLEPSTE